MSISHGSLHTVKEDETFNIIEYSGDEPDGVKVFTQIQGGEGNNLEKAQEGPGNGHGNGEELIDPDEATKRLGEEFSFFGNIENLLKMTPIPTGKGASIMTLWESWKVEILGNSVGDQTGPR